MNRRNFSKLLLAGSGILATSGALTPGAKPARAASPLTLGIGTRTIDVDGRAAKVYGLAGPGGMPGFRLTAGETMDVDLVSSLTEDTMIHWHGLLPEWAMDGVPGMPMPLLKAGETRRYVLPSGKPGTHWMHAHTLQEQGLLAAPLIVADRDAGSRDEQDVVVLLHDFSFKTPEELLAGLKSGGGMGEMNMQGMDHSKMSGMKMGGDMVGMDINDIEYDAYLANDRTLNDPEVVQVEKGGKVRVRIINGATATAFTIDTGALDGEVIAVDGQDIVPLRTRQFPLSMGQRVDFRLQIPKDGGAFPILALREGFNGPESFWQRLARSSRKWPRRALRTRRFFRWIWRGSFWPLQFQQPKARDRSSPWTSWAICKAMNGACSPMQTLWSTRAITLRSKCETVR